MMLTSSENCKKFKPNDLPSPAKNVKEAGLLSVEASEKQLEKVSDATIMQQVESETDLEPRDLVESPKVCESVEGVEVEDSEIIEVMKVPWQDSKKSSGQRLECLLMTSELSDVQVIVEHEENPKLYDVHKLILGMSSSKLRDIINNMEGSQIKITDITPEAFEVMLKYMYLDSFQLEKVDQAVEVFKSASIYNMVHLSKLSKEWLLNNLDLNSFWSVCKFAYEAEDISLKLECGKFLSDHSVLWKSIHNVSKSLLSSVLDIQPMDVSEIDVLRAIDAWAKTQCLMLKMDVTQQNKREVIGPEIVAKIRFAVLSPQEFLSVCCNGGTSSFLSQDETFAILANLNVPECVAWPKGFFKKPLPRGFRKIRVKRRTLFSEGQECTEAHASHCPTVHSRLGYKNFYLNVMVSEKIWLHGVEIPTMWSSRQADIFSTYEESYSLVLLNNNNNILSHKTFRTQSVKYSTFIDLMFDKPIVLNPVERYIICVSTERTYYPLKKFMLVEKVNQYKFNFTDSHIIRAPVSDNVQSELGFVTEIIFS